MMLFIKQRFYRITQMCFLDDDDIVFITVTLEVVFPVITLPLVNVPVQNGNTPRIELFDLVAA